MVIDSNHVEFKVDKLRPIAICEFVEEEPKVKTTKMTNTQLNILKTMAKKGEMNPYAMMKELNIPFSSYPKVLGAFKGLVKLGFLEKVRTEKSMKNRKDDTKIIYGLTQLGLALVVTIHDKTIEESLDIIEKWIHLAPTLFRKWEYIKRMVTKEKAFEEFRSACWRFVHIPRLRDKMMVTKEKAFRDSDLESNFFDGLFYPDTGVGKEEPWLTMLLNDKDLKARAEDSIRTQMKIIESFTNHYQELSKILGVLGG